MQTIERPYEEEARAICEAIRQFNESPEALDNFESYLSYHFVAWLKKWADTPAGMAKEFENFSQMGI